MDHNADPIVRAEVDRINTGRGQVQAVLLRSRLERLETRLRALSPKAADGFLPPLTDDEFDRTWAENDPGFTAPYEIRVWFTWHNGGSGVLPWRGSESLDSCLRGRALWKKDEEALRRWPGFTLKHWIPTGHTDWIADCDGGPDKPCPIYNFFVQDDFYPAARISSLAALVETWHHCLDNNWWIPTPPDSPVAASFLPNRGLLRPPAYFTDIPGVRQGP